MTLETPGAAPRKSDRATRGAPADAEPPSFDEPNAASEDSRVLRAPVDPTGIPGWGVDADDRNDPTWPMRDRSFDDSPGRNWISPSPQPQDIELLMSVEHKRRPAVFGAVLPPS